LSTRLDLSRIHFPGQIGYDRLLALLSISAAHVYFTYPFVLSWSLLDAMACECLVIGSDTAPVREIIKPGENGLLVDFFDYSNLADTITAACREPQRFAALRCAARETIVSKYDRERICEPAWLRLIDELMTT
jgi:glycosyltransferase involved in cell wall biosynthesis